MAIGTDNERVKHVPNTLFDLQNDVCNLATGFRRFLSAVENTISSWCTQRLLERVYHCLDLTEQ